MRRIYASAAALCGILSVVADSVPCACRTLKPDPAAFAECVAALSSRPSEAMACAVQKETQLNVIDVLIAYDLSAQQWLEENEKGSPEAYAAVRVDELNACLSNSHIDAFSFRLAGTALVNEDATVYRDSANIVDLSYILAQKLVSTAGRVVATGEWRKVTDARASLGADIVCVLVASGTRGTVGMSYRLDKNSAPSDSNLSKIPAFGDWAYSVCSIQAADRSCTLPHEIGHTMGCGHPDAAYASPSAMVLGPQVFDYSSGYYFWIDEDGYTTIMGYNFGGLRSDGTFDSGDRFEVLPLFSSPDLTYEGVPVGTTRNDNRKTLLKTYAQVAQYRVSQLPPGADSADEADPVSRVFSQEFRPTAAVKGVAPYVGVVYDGDRPVAILSLKCGKVARSGKKAGKSKVSAVVTGLNGKKKSAKAVDVDCGYDAVATLDVLDWGVLSLTLGGEGFVGTLGDGLVVKTAPVGGTWPHEHARFAVDFEAGSAPLPAGTFVDLLPTGDGAVPVLSEGGRWRVAKAATVKWAAPKGETDKRLVVDGDGNLSALKISYSPKSGTFKGSFKVYALETSGAKAKLKKLAAKVNGFVASGTGYGTAEVKKVGDYPVSVCQDADRGRNSK